MPRVVAARDAAPHTSTTPIEFPIPSGLFTPVCSMPDWAQLMTQLNPVKHFIAIMRAVMLKGAGVTEVVRPLGAQLVFGVTVLMMALRQYGRRAG